MCGDGVKENREACEDGNTLNGDGCSSECLVEPGYECNDESCFEICGDGITTESEECDDDNVSL